MPLAHEAPRIAFLSYAREDSDLVLPVAHLLQAAGATVFIDRDIPYGGEWEPMLLRRLRAAERILVFWSAQAAGSDWVRREYTTAIGAGLRVVPVPLDDTPLPAELARFQALVELVPLIGRARSRPRTPFRWILPVSALLLGLGVFLTLGLSRSESQFSEGGPSLIPSPGALLVVLLFLLLFFGWRGRRRALGAGRELEKKVYQTVFDELSATLAAP